MTSSIRLGICTDFRLYALSSYFEQCLGAGLVVVGPTSLLTIKLHIDDFWLRTTNQSSRHDLTQYIARVCFVMPPPPRTRPSQAVDAFSPRRTSHKRQPHPEFALPINHYLQITTAEGIFTWNSQGVRKIFSSSKKGILAAKASKDGSQVLAVADSNVVVLHDCKLDREDSWGLNAEDGHVRLLEYAPDAKSLYLSTSLTGAIQCYSVHESRMLDPTQTHPSPPTVMAVNATGQLMISASEAPPILYLQNLSLRTPALQLFPAASISPVVLADFHPERPNIFMLAFRDGTLAAYDATQLAKRNGTKMDINSSLHKDGKAGEIGHFNKLHRNTATPSAETDLASGIRSYTSATDMVGTKSTTITGAAFLPGYRSRAVTAGADGRCRIVDFEEGGQILRTWHAQAPVTSLAVLSTKVQGTGEQTVPTGSRSKVAGKAPESPGTLIAVGRADGKVVLFDYLGIKQADTKVNATGESIVGLEWVAGLTPETNLDREILPPEHTIRMRLPSDHTIRMSASRKHPSHVTATVQGPGVPVAEPDLHAAMSVKASNLPENTPKEDAYGTVVRSSVPAGSTLDKPPVQFTTNYLDLFSPVKQNGPVLKQQGHMLQTSPSHQRPRLSSTLFEPKTYSSEDVSPKTATNTSHSATDDNDVEESGKSLAPQPGKSLTEPAPTKKTSSSPKKRAATFMITPGHLITSSSSSNTGSGSSSSVHVSSGQILADLRRVGLAGGNQQRRKGTNKAFFAPYMNRTAASNIRRNSQGRSASNRQSITPKASRVAHVSSAVVSSDSTHDEEPADIWITEGDETDARHKRDVGMKNKFSPVFKRTTDVPKSASPSRRTLSSRPAPPPNVTTALKSPRPLRPPPAPPVQRFLNQQQPAQTAQVNSSDEARYYTAHDYLSPPSAAEATAIDSAWSPNSEQIRRLCPRTSSLSPSRSDKRRRVLREMAPNSVDARGVLQDRSKSQGAKEPEKEGKVVQGTLRVKPKGLKVTVNVCDGCKERQVEISGLKDEVARLRAEVLGLRTVVRRAGFR